MESKEYIESGKAVLGMELGSTRIKAVLIGADFSVLASGEHEWQNSLVDGIWTYDLKEVHVGIQSAYGNLKREVLKKYGVVLKNLAAMGFSAMMHGYLPFDKDGMLLTAFRTWRNTNTEEACKKLTELFDYNIPHRWSIAHLYQSMLNGEEHVKEIDFFTTLAGYVHWQLSGEKVIGVDDASGMFPIDADTKNYNRKMLSKFDELVVKERMSMTNSEVFNYELERLLPKVLEAGAEAGFLTEEGAKLLDPAGDLEAGVKMCPPEGDAGTGMVATNSIAPKSGNISAGTSIFAMIVLERELSKLYPEIDIVSTPDGSPVAMVHCNNGATDIDAWVKLLGETIFSYNNYEKKEETALDMSKLYSILYNLALEGDKDCGGLLSYNYDAGEPISGTEEGRPLFLRTPNSNFTLANFMRTHLLSLMSTTRLGMDILTQREQVKVDRIYGHGGLFKTPVVGQRLMAAALGIPIAVMDTAGEGGAWGIALLAAYQLMHDYMSLSEFLSDRVFSHTMSIEILPNSKDVSGYDIFLERYKAGLEVEKTATILK